ncbi:hypothetical protein CPB85DRAFT_1257151 [Mucidula mucida]|nr:hypothetical protein CPB85DRAFT_1257151 [Mucidula mucida]
MEHHVNLAFVQQPATTGSSEPTSTKSYTPSFDQNFTRGFQAPTQEDVQAITARLEQPDRELLDLEMEIAQITAKLNALKTRRAHLLRHTTQSHAYIAPSPIRQLPTEILQLIFVEACTSYERYEYEMSLHISWVCWKWRQTLATPAIWTKIYYGGLKWYEAFMIYVKRSADLPLSVKINVPYQKRPFQEDKNEWDEYEETWDHHMELMEDVFRATFRRWRDVELYLGMKDLEILDIVADSSSLD